MFVFLELSEYLLLPQYLFELLEITYVLLLDLF